MSEEATQRVDGLINVLTALGTDRDKATHTHAAWVQPLDPMTLRALYRGSKYVGRICDLPAAEATREGWTVDAEAEINDTQNERILRDWQSLELTQKLRKADAWSAAFGGAAVVLGLLDGSESQSEPTDVRRISRVLWARVLHRWQLRPVSWYSDPAADRFGEVEEYEVISYGLANAAVMTRERVHESRVLPFRGVELPAEDLASVDYWGDPRTQRVWEAVRAMGVVEQGSETAMHELRIFVLKLRLLELLEQDGDATVLRRLDLINQSKSVVNGILLDEGEDATQLTVDLSGAAAMYDRFAQSVAAAAEMPMTLLFGHAPAGLSTDDKSGTRYFYNRIRARQVDAYAPNIARAWQYLAAARGYMLDEAPLVSFNSLEQESGLVQSQRHKTEAETDYLYWQADGLEDPRGRVLQQQQDDEVV